MPHARELKTALAEGCSGVRDVILREGQHGFG